MYKNNKRDNKKVITDYLKANNLYDKFINLFSDDSDNTIIKEYHKEIAKNDKKALNMANKQADICNENKKD